MLKSLTVLATAGVLALGTVVVPQQAEARGRGGAVAAGVIGGLAAGAIIGSAINRPAYGYGYYGPSYGYAAYPNCYWQRQRVMGPYGWERRRVRVCY